MINAFSVVKLKHFNFTWFSPKQSCSRNRPFILSTWFAHAQRCMVSAPTFIHEEFHFINATFVEKNWFRHLLGIPSKTKTSLWRVTAIPKERKERTINIPDNSSERNFQSHVCVLLTCSTEDVRSIHKQQWLVAWLSSPRLSCSGFLCHIQVHRTSTTHTNHRTTRKMCNFHYQGPVKLPTPHFIYNFNNKEEEHSCIDC